MSFTPPRYTFKPVPAVTGLLDLFATHPLVALGEAHMLQEEADFITALLHHPAFPATVQVIVVEFGNARYQSIMDRFIAGETVAARDLRPVWQDFFGWGFDAPIYEQFFRTVRAINRTLTPSKRLRVILGDPPFDWSQITQIVDLNAMMEQRDIHYVSVVETHILKPGLKGLLIAGLAHCIREWASPNAPDVHNTVQRLERQHPGNVHVIFPHIGFGAETPALESYLADWPIPSLVSLHTTWLGEIDARLHFDNFLPAGAESSPVKQGFTLKNMADSYLYVGPKYSLTRSTYNPAIYRGDELLYSELQRRYRLVVPDHVLDLLAEGDPRYFPE